MGTVTQTDSSVTIECIICNYKQMAFTRVTHRALDFLVVDSHSCLRDSMPS